MESIKQKLFYVAITMFVATLIAHIISMLGYDIRGEQALEWIFILGILTVFAPAVVLHLIKQVTVAQQHPEGMPPMNVMDEIPQWLGIAIKIVSFYGSALFVYYFFVGNEGTPAGTLAAYYLHDHGNKISDITTEEYHYYRAKELAALSGFWLVFYSLAIMLLFPDKGSGE